MTSQDVNFTSGTDRLRKKNSLRKTAGTFRGRVARKEGVREKEGKANFILKQTQGGGAAVGGGKVDSQSTILEGDKEVQPRKKTILRKKPRGKSERRLCAKTEGGDCCLPWI